MEVLRQLSSKCGAAGSCLSMLRNLDRKLMQRDGHLMGSYEAQQALPFDYIPNTEGLVPFELQNWIDGFGIDELLKQDFIWPMQ